MTSAMHWLWARVADGSAALVAVALIYGLAVVLVRWHMIAKPIRNLIQARIRTIEAEVERVKAGVHGEHVASIKELLRRAGEIQPSRFRPWDFFFWSRGHETATWKMIDEADSIVVETWGHAKVEARLDAVLADVRSKAAGDESSLGQKALAVAGVIEERRKAVEHGGAAGVEEVRALLQEAMRVQSELLERDDQDLDYHGNKIMWHIGVALLAIVLIGTAGRMLFTSPPPLEQLAWLLAGAIGGVLSRAILVVKKPSRTNDYGVPWMVLFLSPLVGALAGWAGMALVRAGAVAQGFGPLQSTTGASLYMAVLFGFSESLFAKIAGTSEEGVTPKPKPEKASSGSESAPPAPHVQPPELAIVTKSRAR